MSGRSRTVSRPGRDTAKRLGRRGYRRATPMEQWRHDGQKLEKWLTRHPDVSPAKRSRMRAAHRSERPR